MKSFKRYIEEQASCDFISFSQLKRIESALDKAFKKYDINFDFTKHFGDRMSDERNKPCIAMKELAAVFTKIYKNQGKKIKSHKDWEAVIKDISSDINIPIAVEFERGEFRVALKTIMRKKAFSTPNQVLKYE